MTVISTLRVGKLRHRGTRSHAQHHTAARWWGWDLHPCSQGADRIRGLYSSPLRIILRAEATGEQWASGAAHKILIINVLAFACFYQVRVLEFTDSYKLEAQVVRLGASRST